MSSIGPHVILTPSTRVRVKNHVGYIIDHWIAPNGVVVHRIHVTAHLKRGFGQTYTQTPMSKIIEPNYSFVTILD